MNKNIKRMGVTLVAVMLMSGAVVTSAASWSSETSTSTPRFGGVTYNRSVSNNKTSGSVYGSQYATYQQTALAHQIALAYFNTNNTLVQGSNWTDATVNSIKHPELSLIQVARNYYSAAKSANLEPTNNTVVKYRFSADNI